MPDNKQEIDVEQLTRLRHNLHRNAELSGHEDQTVKIIKDYIQSFQPDEVLENIGGKGIAFVFRGKNPGKTIVFRADLDALPIHEDDGPDYLSENSGISHKCGHDGHMTILAGLAELLFNERIIKGKVILLFQAEEETGTGAEKVVSHSDFQNLYPDFVFGLHNLPGYQKNTILIKKGSFAAASKGVIIDLKGRSSHAGHPENGNNPAIVISELIQFIKTLNENTGQFEDFTLATVIHIRLGEVAFGTAPGEAKFMITLRAFSDDDIRRADEMIRQKTDQVCEIENIKYNIRYTEVFPATINHDNEVDIIKNAAEYLQLECKNIGETFRWSEDFGHYLNHYKGAFFGIGAGKNTPQLHNPEYDFPDDLITTGIKMFYQIYKRIIAS